MEYSELVSAVLENDQSRMNKILRELLPVIVSFLKGHMGASKEDAEDCAQQTILLTIDTIKSGKIRDPDRIYYYVMTTSKNNYLKLVDSNKEYHFDQLPKDAFRNPKQIENIIEKERKVILQECMEELSDSYRKFIEYWFENPDSSTTRVAKHFGITVNNAWTRKHRVLNMLNKCYEKKNKI